MLSIGIKEVAIFVGGVAVGLYLAKLYARNQVNSEISSGLNRIGLGAFAPSVEGLVTPQVVG